MNHTDPPDISTTGDTFESLLRVGLDNIASTTPTLEPVEFHPAVRPLVVSEPSKRHTIVYAAAAAAVVAVTVGGLFAASDRAADRTTQSNQPTAESTETAWHQTLRPLIPAQFDYLVLTSAADDTATFVAIDSAAGKSLELVISSASVEEPPAASDDAVDSIGIWTATPVGWQVVTTDGVFAEVSCNIGVRGRDFAGPPNYCDTASTGATTTDDLRAIAGTVASRDLIDSALREAAGIRDVTTSGIDDLIARVLADQRLIGDTFWTDADHIWDYSANTERPDTSVRIVTGVQAPPALATAAGPGLYDDGAAFWIVHPSGVALRISTTDPRPESLDRLRGLADDILEMITE